jgi:hypothetical protein
MLACCIQQKALAEKINKNKNLNKQVNNRKINLEGFNNFEKIDSS